MEIINNNWAWFGMGVGVGLLLANLISLVFEWAKRV